MFRNPWMDFYAHFSWMKNGMFKNPRMDFYAYVLELCWILLSKLFVIQCALYVFTYLHNNIVLVIIGGKKDAKQSVISF